MGFFSKILAKLGIGGPTKRAYGFRSFDLLELALYQTLGELPEPEVTHRYCG